MERCPHCDEKFEEVGGPYNYTAAAGLDPRFHKVELHGIHVLRCACGVSPVIRNIDGLHATLVLALIYNEAPWDRSAYRFVRKTLGLTQEQFADAVDVTPVTVSKWENNGPWPDIQGETALRVFVLALLLEREEFEGRLDPRAAMTVIKRLHGRLTGSGKCRRQSVCLEAVPDGVPPAWMICRMGEDGHSARNHHS